MNPRAPFSTQRSINWECKMFESQLGSGRPNLTRPAMSFPMGGNTRGNRMKSILALRIRSGCAVALIAGIFLLLSATAGRAAQSGEAGKDFRFIDLSPYAGTAEGRSEEHTSE